VVDNEEMLHAASGIEIHSQILGLSGCLEDNMSQCFILILDENNYAWYANRRKVHIDQRNSVIHELIHLMEHALSPEDFARAIADYEVRGPR
jgi:hypothetical protein